MFWQSFFFIATVRFIKNYITKMATRRKATLLFKSLVPFACLHFSAIFTGFQVIYQQLVRGFHQGFQALRNR